MKRLIHLLILAFISTTSHAQTSPDDLVKTFFAEYEKDAAKAVQGIYDTNPWTSRIKDAIEKVKQEVNSYTEDYVGKYYGYESITRKQLSTSFLLMSYLVKYDRQPMRFTFEWYKPNDTWMLQSFQVDVSIDDEVEEAAKVYRLDELR
ncbi:MAG: hypothetical protein ABI432_11635 [Flavobacteriales bacterium]